MIEFASGVVTGILSVLSVTAFFTWINQNNRGDDE